MIRKQLIYLNGPRQVHLYCPVSDGNNRKAYKTCLKLSIGTRKKHRLAEEGTLANIAEAVAKV